MTATADQIAFVRGCVQYGAESLREKGGQEAINRLAKVAETIDQHSQALVALTAEFTSVSMRGKRDLSIILVAALAGAAVMHGLLAAEEDR